MFPSRSHGLLLAVLVLLTATGCVERGLQEWAEPFDYGVTPGHVTPSREPARGAIWRGDKPSGSFLFYDQKATGVGDLVTVRIQESARAFGTATTDLDRTGSVGLQASSDIGLVDFASQFFRSIGKLLGITPPPGPAAGATANFLNSDTSSTFEGEGTTERSGTFTAIVTCRVLQVLPGDVFHIRGRRSIVINHEEQFLTVEGLVRKQDIRIDNSVPSSAIAEARLAIDGVGVIDEKQRPGLIARALDWVFPF